MLTDEEIMEMRNRAKLNDNRQIDPMAFARDIERAVLAKAMQKQEPVAHAVYQGCLSGVHVSMLSNAPKDFSGYLYATPFIVQAAAIPEGWQLVPVEPTKEMCDAYCEHSIAPISNLSRYGYKAMLSASPKPE